MENPLEQENPKPKFTTTSLSQENIDWLKTIDSSPNKAIDRLRQTQKFERRVASLEKDYIELKRRFDEATR